jgi:cysteine-rich repeat protein
VRRALLITTVLVAGCNQLLGLDPVTDRDGGGATIDSADGPRDGAVPTDATLPIDAMTCGNGVVDSGEACDDSNTASNDGCSSSCQRELHIIGCDDGEREGFEDLATFTRIAACGGLWSTPGLPTTRSGTTGCGDDGVNSSGTSCNALDVCADGWTVCASRNDVAVRLNSRPCTDAAGFYASRQLGTAKSCTLGPSQVVHGCGVIGIIQPIAFCAPLTANLGAGCEDDLGWSCSKGSEAATLVHASGDGGVLCCK